MAMVKCPDCGKDISSSAMACPNCGHPMKAALKPKGEGCFLQTLNIGCALVLIVIIFIVIVLWIASST